VYLCASAASLSRKMAGGSGAAGSGDGVTFSTTPVPAAPPPASVAPDYTTVLGDVSRVLEQPQQERQANLERYARCVTMRFRRKPPCQEEQDLRSLMPVSLARTPELWEYTTCSICLIDFADGEELRQTPCAGGHAFHPKCLRGWLDRSNTTCPVCRGGDDERSAKSGTEEDNGMCSAAAAVVAATRERSSPEATAEFIMRRMRSGKVDMTISAGNHKKSAKIVRQIREEMQPEPRASDAVKDSGQKGGAARKSRALGDEDDGVPALARLLEARLETKGRDCPSARSQAAQIQSPRSARGGGANASRGIQHHPALRLG